MSGLLSWDRKVPRDLRFSKHVDLDDKDDDHEIHFFQITGPLQNKTKGDYMCPLLGYLLTSWSIIFLEKLTGSQLVKKFPAFYGTRMFITAFTSLHHLLKYYAAY